MLLLHMADELSRVSESDCSSSAQATRATITPHPRGERSFFFNKWINVVPRPPQITSAFQPHYIECSILLFWLLSLIELSNHFYTAARHPRNPHLSLSVEACLTSNYLFYFRVRSVYDMGPPLAHCKRFGMNSPQRRPPMNQQ